VPEPEQRGQGAVLVAAIKMQKLLEEKAAADEKESGVYIRPIVLLQAESRNKTDSTTYEKINVITIVQSTFIINNIYWINC